MAFIIRPREDILIPRANIFFSRLREDGTFDPYRFLGNTPEASMTPEIETAEAFDAGSPIRRRLKRPIIAKQFNVSLTVQEVLWRNLAMYFGGEVSEVTQASDAVTDEPLGSGPVVGDAYYHLGESDSNPAGVRGVSDVILHSDPDVTYEAGKDFEVDKERGRIFIPGDSACVGETVLVDYDLQAVKWNRLVTRDDLSIVHGRMRFISANVAGRQRDYFAPFVEISGDGDFQFTSESDWQSVGFAVTALSPEDAFGNAMPPLYVDDLPVVVEE